MKIIYLAFFILPFSLQAQAGVCDDAKLLADKACSHDKIDVVVIKQKFKDGEKKAEDSIKKNDRGGAASAADSGNRIVSAVTDLDTYSQNCYKEIVSCSKACGQTVPDPIPAGLALDCMTGTRAANYNVVQQIGKQMCTTVAQHEGLMGQISIPGASYPFCSSFMSADEMDKIAGDNVPEPNKDCTADDNNCSMVPDTAPIAPKKTLASALKTLGDSIDKDIETASPKRDEGLREPSAWLGFAVRYGDDQIGVAKSDLFLMVEDRLSKIQREMEN